MLLVRKTAASIHTLCQAPKKTYHDSSVERHSLIRRNTFTGRLLVSSIQIRRDHAAGPRVTLVPVLMPECREVVTIVGWIGDVSDKQQDRLKEFLAPAGIKVRNHSCSVDMITIMEMQVVVKGYIKKQRPTG